MYDLVRENSYPTSVANSSLLPLMLISLASQNHSPSNTKTTDSILSEYDFIIVGAGSAGSTLAGRLSEVPCVNVLLLEAGPAPPLLSDVPIFATNFGGSDIDWAYKTVSQKYTARLQKKRKLPWLSGKSLGGSSIVNAMLFVRGNKQNYDNWAAQGALGWGYEDVLPYFKKLEDNQDAAYVKNGYHGVGGPMTVESSNYNPPFKASILEAASELGYSTLDPNGPVQTGFYKIQANTRNYQRCSTAKAYLVPAENRTNLHVLPNARVLKVLIKNDQAVGILFEANGTRHRVSATREVIVSAGTVNTAQLLMLSGIGPKKELKKHKIHLVKDLPVGKNFHDHCVAQVVFALDPSIPTSEQKLKNEDNIKEYINNKTGVLSSTSILSALAFLNTDPKPAVDFPTFQLYLQEATVDFFKGIGLKEEAYERAYKPYEKKPVYFCGSQILQPRSRGYIRLQSSDPYDPPLINPKYYSHADDLQDAVEGIKTCHKIALSKAMQEVGSQLLNTTLPGCEMFDPLSEEYFRCFARSIGVSPNHQVGTCKMGLPKDSTTVVDPELKVKGIRGLRVVDASVIPIIPSGNTNVPTIMVAEKAADIIKGSIVCQQSASGRSGATGAEAAAYASATA